MTLQLRGPLAKEINIDSLGLEWGPAESAGNGEWVVRKAPATAAFWTAYRSHKEALKSIGIGCSKNGDAWFATHFARPTRNELDRRAEERDLSRAADAGVIFPAPNGLTRYPYQNAGIAYGLRKKSILIGDQMGLGKTGQAIGVIDFSGAKNALIVCPASLKLNWARELSMWLTRKLSVGVIKPGKTNWPNTDIVVINYDLLKKYDEQVKAREWDVLVLDEAHYLKGGGKVARARAAFGNRNEGVKPIRAKRKVALTGTPIDNRPNEIWPIIHYLEPAVWSSWRAFVIRYCDGKQTAFGYDSKGASNLDELQDRLRATAMIRRLKEDVLKELPPKTRQILALPSNGAEHEIAAEMEAFTNCRERISELRAKFELAKAAVVDGDYRQATEKLREGVSEAFTAMARARKAVAIAKLPTMIDHVEEALDAGNKVIFFCHHREVHDSFTHHFGERAVGIIGGDSIANRQAAVDAFQKDKSIRLFVGSIGAAGVGITLTASSHVIMGELDWVPGNMVQAEDRAHRIGQLGNVLSQWIVLEGSLDSQIAKTLARKAEIIEQALDRKNDGDRPEIEPQQAFADKVSIFENEEAATKQASRDRIAKEAEHITPADIMVIHDGLRLLAAMDADGARAKNMAGFAKIDSRVGRELAGNHTLTTRQAALGLRIVKKYAQTQLGSDMAADVKEIWTRVTGREA